MKCVICNRDTDDCCPLCGLYCCSSCVTEELCLECANPNCNGPKDLQSCCELCIENAKHADLDQCREEEPLDPEDCEHPFAFTNGDGMEVCPDCGAEWQLGDGHDWGAEGWINPPWR